MNIFMTFCIISMLVQAPISGNATIKGDFAGSAIKITTTDRLAGAIHSVTWRGKEFINSTDHGRQLQSASSFDAGQKDEFWPECFNPTEAGSRRDGAGAKSSSHLLEIKAEKNVLVTTSRSAFWLLPGEKSVGRLALNTTVLSNHYVSKVVKIGIPNHPNVIDYDVTFRVPEGEGHTMGQFEALTGYMPADFERFWRLDTKTGKLEPLDDGPGEQDKPVILATADGAFAMGVIGRDRKVPGANGPGYGRFRFGPENVVKWNCVYRVRDPNGIKAGDYQFRMFVALGTLEDVRKALFELSR